MAREDTTLIPLVCTRPVAAGEPIQVLHMLHWAIIFLIIAIVAGLLGFTTVMGAAMGFAKILFVIFLILFVLMLVMGRRPPSV